MPTTYRLAGTHKTHAWTREQIIIDGWPTSRYRVSPPDGTDPRTVEMISAGSWSNNPADDRANVNQDRVVHCDGPALPPWAVAWLDTVHRKACARGRAALRAALDDADDNDPAWRDTGW